jgi:hypothetical protein
MADKTVTTKMYVVVGGVAYEGYSMPRGIFDNIEDAKRVAAENDGDDFVYVLEYEINKRVKDPQEIK